MATILKRQQQPVEPTPIDSAATTHAESTGISLPSPHAKSGVAQVLKGNASDSRAEPTEPAQFARGGVAARLSGAVIGKEKAGSDGFVDFNLADIVEQGRRQIVQCREQVEEMLQKARVEGEAIKAQAKSQGHAEGTQVASAEIEKRIATEAENKAQAQIASLRKSVVQMRKQYDDWMKEYAEVMTATALSAAERLLRKRIELPNASLLAVEPELEATNPEDAKPGNPNPEKPVTSGSMDVATSHSAGSHASKVQHEEHLLLRWAREALHSTRSAGRLTLAVHPDTLAELGRQFDELLSSPDLPEQSHVIPDESLAVGDVVVRQDGGEIRAGLDAQLQRLREELL